MLKILCKIENGCKTSQLLRKKHNSVSRYFTFVLFLEICHKIDITPNGH